MKLSTRELKYLSEIDTRRTRRRRDAWIYLVAAILLTVLTNYVETFSSLADPSIYGMGIAIAVWHLAHVYFAVRPEDKLVELLQRYVNQDPEAIAQFVEATASDGVSEEEHARPAI